MPPSKTPLKAPLNSCSECDPGFCAWSAADILMGSTSDTAWIVNFIRCGSAFHSFAQVTFLSIAFSHLVQKHNFTTHFLITTVLQDLSSSTAALTFPRTRQCSSVLPTMPLWSDERDPSPALSLVIIPSL